MALAEEIAQEEKNIADLTEQLSYFHSEGTVTDWFYSNIGPYLEATETSIDKVWGTASDFSSPNSPISIGKNIYDSVKNIIGSVQSSGGNDQETAERVIKQLGTLATAAQKGGVLSKQDSNEISGLISALQSGKALQDGNYKEYVAKLIDSIGSLSFVQKHAPFFKAAKAGKALNDIKQSFKKALKDKDEFNSINAKKEEIERKLRESKAKLENLRKTESAQSNGGLAGSSGSTSAGGSHSANVFTRIADLLAEIDAKLQHVQSNLQV